MSPRVGTFSPSIRAKSSPFIPHPLFNYIIFLYYANSFSRASLQFFITIVEIKTQRVEAPTENLAPAQRFRPQRAQTASVSSLSVFSEPPSRAVPPGIFHRTDNGIYRPSIARGQLPFSAEHVEAPGKNPHDRSRSLERLISLISKPSAF